jgi:hypothetical protein
VVCIQNKLDEFNRLVYCLVIGALFIFICGRCGKAILISRIPEMDRLPGDLWALLSKGIQRLA